MSMASALWDWYAALGYDALNALLPYAALQEAVLTALAPAPGERLFIAGCGTGNLEARALGRVDGLEIDALDFSATMLARARAKCAGYPSARHHRGDLCQRLPFADAAFDAAVMCNVLYALPDRQAARAEISRLVRPGGRFTLCDRQPVSDPEQVTRAHFTMLRALPGRERLRGWGRTLGALPPLLAVAAINRRIQRRMESGAYYFYPIEEITSLLDTLGFTVTRVEPAYAEQCWLLQARRRAEER
ncbi:MAG TPA: methyltransferase domain-containing protein [Armatimonadota bacterium]|nr:methyltransferase domain-containing protein [Armatimonadota bacterium]